jgi:hypothetical protein
MFDWLEQEISAIGTPRFHVVDGPADEKLREAVLQSDLFLPASYLEFVLRFGNAKLYRVSHNNSYQIGVFAGPRVTTQKDGTLTYHLGFHDDTSVYIKLGYKPIELPIFEFDADEEEQVAENFQEWLETSCAQARNTYDKRQWAEIVRGPKPFTAKEEAIIEARRQIQWRVLGIDAAGNHKIEVTNAGSCTLPAFKIGVRSKDGRLNGAVRLGIGDLGPGQTTVLHVGCYKDFRRPDELEVFQLPDPMPEDRAGYPEFGET